MSTQITKTELPYQVNSHGESAQLSFLKIGAPLASMDVVCVFPGLLTAPGSMSPLLCSHVTEKGDLRRCVHIDSFQGNPLSDL